MQMLGYPQQPLGGGTLGNVGATGVQGLIADPTAGTPGGLLGNYHPALATYYNGMPTQIIRRSLRGDRLTDPNYDPRVIPGHPSPAPGLPTPPGTEPPPDVATPGGAAPAAAGMSDFQKWLQSRNDPGDNLVEEAPFGNTSGYMDTAPSRMPGLMHGLMSNITPASMLGMIPGLGIGGMIAGKALGYMMPEMNQPLFGMSPQFSSDSATSGFTDADFASAYGTGPGANAFAFNDPGYGYGMGDLGYSEDGGAFDDFGGEAAFDAGDIDAVGDDSW
jgi:hypothetical protein